jgi:hypothetical protein
MGKQLPVVTALEKGSCQRKVALATSWRAHEQQELLSAAIFEYAFLTIFFTSLSFI